MKARLKRVVFPLLGSSVAAFFGRFLRPEGTTIMSSPEFILPFFVLFLTLILLSKKKRSPFLLFIIYILLFFFSALFRALLSEKILAFLGVPTLIWKVTSGSNQSGNEGSEASVNQLPPVQPPLLDDQTREEELNDRLGIHWAGLSYNPGVRDSFVQTQAQIEKHVEATLVADGYSRDAVFARRHQIRGFLFYPQGRALSESTYLSYLREIRENGTRQSLPYRRILRALQNYDLFLD